MECNKDEAVRAKAIAERKFTERDFAGAKKFALKAQTLYPGLENISQMLSTLEVYLSAESRIHGEMDMYRILGVSPLADEDLIKKNYKKLVLLLHPDKNKSIGADGAFQLVQEAYNLLSDKAKRSAYNSRCNVRTYQQKVPPQSGVSTGPTSGRQFDQKFSTQAGVSAVPPRTGKKVDQKVPQGGNASRTGGQTYRSPSSFASQYKVPTESGNSTVPPETNGYHGHPAASSRFKQNKSNTPKASTATQAFFKKGDIFWTVCTKCKMQYEYMRVYLNQVLKCPHCQEGFMAVEIPPPSNLSPVHPPQQKVKSSWSSGTHSFGFNNSVSGTSTRWSPMSGTTAYNNISYSSFIPDSTTGASDMMNDRKREREESQEATGWERSNDSGFVFKEESSKRSREEKGATVNETGFGNIGTAYWPNKENSEAGRVHFSQGVSSKLNFHRELSQLELRKMLTDMATGEIRSKLNEWKFSSEARAAAKGKSKVKVKDRQKQKLMQSNVMQDLERNASEGSKCNNSSLASPANAEQETVQIDIMSVPDPDFHIFDLDRSESCFGENQVWAAYDDDDGMPRFYGMIHEVISFDPFEVRMSWLNSKSNTEFSPVDWIGRGFLKTCGQFWVGKHVTNNSLNSFSHRVKWVKGPRGVVQIYPSKGEIWALYRDWSPDWDENTPDKIKHAYEMVEVLSDYNEKQGVTIALLCKASGFQTVFYKQLEQENVRLIPKEEMFRFSHQVPSYTLKGNEKPNAPKGYVELDPAATPPDLLKAISLANEKATDNSNTDPLSC